ncbi:MAG: 50S ribosomal protein L21 [Deltaproteobacteria bacterium RIFCSPLOWO2_02_FULL_44_10]|nr:MAG: 50S ribosomal protein L21 [Deltaproteobacteria bacterium RIFCSPHIGHO2_02_FULL_44_16]OGQ46706.1 MAG: 50S ribosomal protein L21 [Deltaproteobacteria bacterium RIFCSPLOWO2_02_FULL_44_10]
MYAIVRTGGKQYRVSKGERFFVEKLEGDVGSVVTLDDILLIGGKGDVKLGTPTIAGAAISAKIVDQGRDKKVIVFKKKRRKGYSKKQGHRQPYTQLEVTEVKG